MENESILHRLCIGYLPTSIETKNIQMDLISFSVDLLRLNEQISDLSIQRDKLEESVRLQKALISPIRRLPDNVVRDIFSACLPSNGGAAISAKEAPLLLCHISRTWRALALGTPILWASLHIPLEFALRNKERETAVARVNE
ncbi:hypothetical protein C8R43DRAFT_892128 [Mycena crocata]|nr:hypothetical protein C8R43DRAFT_892128 [Mycena crocata]